MASRAQTHLQFYRQMQDAEYSTQDLVLVDRAYRLAMQLFAGHYRPNNKPFIAHLVGTASILAAVHQPAFVVAAGLLHSAYWLGLGRKGAGVKPRYRKDLAALLGAQAERLVYNYSNRRWSVEDFRLSADDVRSLAAEERQLYLIKLADVHEEFLDAGHLYQPRKKLLWDQDASASWLPDASQLIQALGFDAWAREFQRAIENRSRAIPAEIRGEASGSRILAPGWANSHWKNRVVRWLSRH
jgi:(p)ppGpp synthase/HD superfamily hydrolase